MSLFPLWIIMTFIACFLILFKIVRDCILYGVPLPKRNLALAFLYVAAVNACALIFFDDMNLVSLTLFLGLIPLGYFYYLFSKWAVKQWIDRPKPENTKNSTFLWAGVSTILGFIIYLIWNLT